MDSTLLVDKFRGWAWGVVIVVTIAMVLVTLTTGLVSKATHSRLEGTFSNVTHYHQLDEDHTDLECIQVTTPLTLYQKWADFYLDMKPQTDIFTHFYFPIFVQVNITKENNDHESTWGSHNNFTVSCFRHSCEQKMVNAYPAVTDCNYTMLFCVNSTMYDSLSQNVTLNIVLYVNQVYFTLANLTVVIVLTIANAIFLVVVLAISFYRRRFDTFFWSTLMLLALITFCNDPLLLIGYGINVRALDYIDFFLLDAYNIVFFCYLFFFVDFFNNVALNKPMNYRPWIFRGILFFLYLVFIIGYLIFSADNTDNVVPQERQAEFDFYAIKIFLQFVIIIWVFSIECKAYASIANPTNKSRLKLLIFMSWSVFALDIVQLFSSFSSISNHDGIPGGLRKVNINWFVFIVTICFFPVSESDPVYQELIPSAPHHFNASLSDDDSL